MAAAPSRKPPKGRHQAPYSDWWRRQSFDQWQAAGRLTRVSCRVEGRRARRPSGTGRSAPRGPTGMDIRVAGDHSPAGRTHRKNTVSAAMNRCSTTRAKARFPSPIWRSPFWMKLKKASIFVSVSQPPTEANHRNATFLTGVRHKIGGEIHTSPPVFRAKRRKTGLPPLCLNYLKPVPRPRHREWLSWRSRSAG